jgi:protein-tyrosine phosphatase
MKILMVCLGNICRSPLAEGILKEKTKKLGLNWEISSAGTSGYHIGCPPHEFSQKVGLLNGIDISDQCCRQLVKTDILEFDRIYVMDSSNYNDVRRISGEHWQAEKVELIMNELYPGKNMNVPDPWYGGEDGYHEVYKMLDQACEAILEKYSNKQSAIT